jgi:hypothetical protein
VVVVGLGTGTSAVAPASSVAAVAIGAPAPAATSVPAGASRFVPLSPRRILDTRIGLGGFRRLGAGRQITLQVTGRAGVPAGAAAVAFNLTAVAASGAGYFTVWPAGSSRPVVSNLNVTGPGQVVANSVVVALPGSGRVSLFSQSGADLVADVSGYFVRASSATAGRLVSRSPVRLLDTRTGNGAPRRFIGARRSIDLQVTGRGGVPSRGVSAVALTVTATNAAGAGYVTVWPAGAPRPLASALNLPGAGATVPNLVIVPLGVGGRVRLFTYAGAHLLADVAGWVTGPGSARTTAGLFVPKAPARIVDTRLGRGGHRLLAKIDASVAVGGVGGVPTTNVAAALVNLTVTNTSAAGFVTIWPARTLRPTASNVNMTGPGQTVASAAVANLGQGGRANVFAWADADLVVDVGGYFLGAPTPADARYRPPSPYPPRPGLDWFSAFNFYRGTARVSVVANNAAWAASEVAHSRWMVLNHTICHCETPGTAGYSAAGDLAGRSSNIALGYGFRPTQRGLIEEWMAAPFHAAGMIDPRLHQSAFGYYTDGTWWGTAVDVLRGQDRVAIGQPVVWPGNGATVPLTRYAGSETPDPARACPGYAGLPIVALLPEDTAGARASVDGVQTCVFDSHTFPAGDNGRAVLAARHTVVIMVRSPLAVGRSYTVRLHTDARDLTWTFAVGAR